MKSKANAATVLPDDADSVTLYFHIADGVPYVTFTFPGQGKVFTHPISDYSSLSGAQKTTLRAMLTALRDETFTLEGYS